MEKQKAKDINKKVTLLKNRKLILYIVLLLIIIYIMYTIYLLIKQPTDVFTVENGELYLEETSVGYVIRDEKVVKGENYKNGIEQIKAEGERTSTNESIFRYYSNNEENLKRKIADLDTKIQEIMANDTSLFTSDMKLLENQIDEKIANISKTTDTTKLTEYKKDLEALVTKKAKIAGDSSPKGSHLRQLIEERKNYESQLNSGAEYVKAPMSGIVSYKVDGLEDVLTPKNFSELSKEYLEKLDLKTGKIVATSDESGKVIDNFYCYIATILNSEQARQAKVGDNVRVRLSNNVEVPAEITNIFQEDGNEILIVLKLNKQIEELINYRKISFDFIWWKDKGLKVPNQAIVEIDGLKYVVRNRAGYLNKILVNVIRQGEKYSIVEAYKTEKLKELGFTNEDIASYKKISLYDEVLLNPNLEKIQ